MRNRDLERMISLQEQIEINDPQKRCNQCFSSECVGGPYVPGDSGSLICYTYGNDMGKYICRDYTSNSIINEAQNNDFDVDLFVSTIINKINTLYEQTDDYEQDPDYEVKWE